MLTSETASAPPRSAAFAGAVMSATFGVSFTIIGQRRTRRQRSVSFSSSPGSTPKSSPFATLGHETLSSIASIPSSRANAAQRCSKSSIDSPATFTIRAVRIVPERRQHLADPPVEPGVLDADRVEHPRRGLDDARRRIPFAARGRDALRRPRRRSATGRRCPRLDAAAEGPGRDEDGVPRAGAIRW